jgi:hypothetical protein
MSTILNGFPNVVQFLDYADSSKSMDLDLTNISTGSNQTWKAPTTGGSGFVILALTEGNNGDILVSAGGAGSPPIFDSKANQGLVNTAAFTAGRVPFAQSATVLIDDADFTFVTDTLTITKIVTSGGITSYKGVTTAGSGVAAIYAAIDRTAQVAAIGATTLASTAGYYAIHYTLEDTTADLAAGTIQFQVNYTDDIGATTQAGAALALTATGRDRGSFEVYLASGNLQYQTNLVGLIGTAAYALRVRAEYMG